MGEKADHRRGWHWVPSIVGAPGLVLALVGAYFIFRWVAYDDPNVSFRCQQEATCSTGDAANMRVGLLLSGLGVVTLAVAVCFWLFGARRDRSRAALLASGHRAPGVVVAVARTKRSNKGVRYHRVTIEARPGPSDSEAFTFSMITPHPPPVGTSVTVAFDPARPGEGLVLDDLEHAYRQRPGITISRGVVVTHRDGGGEAQ